MITFQNFKLIISKSFFLKKTLLKNKVLIIYLSEKKYFIKRNGRFFYIVKYAN